MRTRTMLVYSRTMLISPVFQFEACDCSEFCYVSSETSLFGIGLDASLSLPPVRRDAAWTLSVNTSDRLYLPRGVAVETRQVGAQGFKRNECKRGASISKRRRRKMGLQERSNE